MKSWLKGYLINRKEDQIRVYKLTSNADIRAWGTVELLEEESRNYINSCKSG